MGILEGPGTIAVSAGLSKTFVVRERLRFRFESTFTNVLNHTNFDQVGTSFSFDPLHFGQVISARDARIIQLGLKLLF